MFEFHKDRKRYFDIQVANASEYVIPFIEKKFTIKEGMRVLEIGCGEGGVLKAFLQKGCTGLGVEFDIPRIEDAKQFMPQETQSGKIKFISKDIYNVNAATELDGLFDIIILKDVIEHIHDQAKLIAWMKNFLQPHGIIFFGFPPWYMPFGGHQQMCRTKLMQMPYIHLLPKQLYKWLLKKNNEAVDDLMEIRETQITIERFEKICKQTNYTIIHKTHYLLNPIYKWKFNVKPRKQFAFIQAIPFVRNFFTTCVYYAITPN